VQIAVQYGSVSAYFRGILHGAQTSTHHFANFNRSYLDRKALFTLLDDTPQLSLSPLGTLDSTAPYDAVSAYFRGIL